MPDQPENKRTDNEKKADWQGDLITTDTYSVNNTKLLYFIWWQDWRMRHSHFFPASTVAAISQAYCHLKFVLEIFDTRMKNTSHYNHENIIPMICLFPTDFLATSTT